MRIKVHLDMDWVVNVDEKEATEFGDTLEEAVALRKQRIEEDDIGAIIATADNRCLPDNFTYNYSIVADGEKTFTCPHCGLKYSAKAKYMRDEFDVDIWTSTCPNCKELNYISKCYWR